MKKLFIVLAFVGFSVATMAQDTTEDTTEKYSVCTNSFWSNWFVQIGAQWAAFYVSEEHGQGLSKSPFKSFRSNPQVAIAIGKWFTPGIGLRTKVSGIWGKACDESFKYWNAQEQVLFNLSNLICGYNPDRIYNCVPFAGGGIARNCDASRYSMGLSVGLLNQFYVIKKKLAINLELGWNRLENDFYGGGGVDGGDRGWDSHDNYFYAEVGVTYNLGKASWEKKPDVDAIKALSQSQIDALKAQLDDANAENARLKQMLANQPRPAPVQTVKEVVSAPISIFFNLNKTDIASQAELLNLQEIAKYAKEHNSHVLITGYADSATGKEGHNQWLSEQRAETVKGEVVKMGVDEANITTEGKGGVDILSPISYNRRAVVQIVE